MPGISSTIQGRLKRQCTTSTISTYTMLNKRYKKNFAKGSKPAQSQTERSIAGSCLHGVSRGFVFPLPGEINHSANCLTVR